jgi:hypothetical protein
VRRGRSSHLRIDDENESKIWMCLGFYSSSGTLKIPRSVDKS